MKLIAPEAVKPFVKKGKKNDAADAAAICEAASRPDVKFVPVKTVEQQGVLALHTARALLVKQQTMLANAIRGLAVEFGVTWFPRGCKTLSHSLRLVNDDEAMPKRRVRRLPNCTSALASWPKASSRAKPKSSSTRASDATARRLMTIPGIGPITASLIAATVVDISLFKSARQFAAWLGLVPRQHSTGGKTRLGRITKAGTRRSASSWC